MLEKNISNIVYNVKASQVAITPFVYQENFFKDDPVLEIKLLLFNPQALYIQVLAGPSRSDV